MLLTFQPYAHSQPPRWEAKITATAYCLSGRTTSGVRTRPGCIALSRDLAKNLGLYRGPGPYDYRFGAIVEIEGMGQFTFLDLMPAYWRLRVDIYKPSIREAKTFGIKRSQIRVISKQREREVRNVQFITHLRKTIGQR